MKALARRIGLIVLGLILLVAIIGSAFFVEMQRHFHPPAPALHYPQAVNALAAQRQDLDYFRQLIALDRSFAATGRAEANRRLDTLEALGTVLDKAHFRVALMQIDALADNGHSRVENDDRAPPMELPVRVVAFSDGLYIVRTTEANAALLGGRVSAIDGQPIEAVMVKLQQLRGGTTQWRRLMAAQYLTLQDMLFGVDVAPDMQHSNWTVETPSGTSISRRLTASAPPANEPVTGMAEPWQTFEPARALPPAWRDFDTAFRSLTVPGSCTQLVQLKSNADQGGQRIKEFLAGTVRQMRQARPCNVIFDLRYDGGGDYVNTYGFARQLPQLVAADGKIFVLIGPATFSAGISTAAFVKHAGQGHVVILGEAVGDRLQFYSEGGWACLPHYPLCVAYETGKHDYQHACTQWEVCFWLNYFIQYQVASLDPDEVIPLSFEKWRAGVDPVVDRALSLARDNGVSP